MKNVRRASSDYSGEAHYFYVPADFIKKSPLRVKRYVQPWYQPRPYLRIIEKKIMEARLAKPFSKVRRRFAIQLPPRSGKTEFVSKSIPSYFLGRWPDDEIIICSYNARKALNYSSKIREIFQLPKFQNLFDVKLKPDTRSKERWEIDEHRGGLTAAGFGGAITGEGGNLIAVDDPYKNHEEAFSKTIRDSRWNEFNDTLLTRVNDENAIIILVGYPWHPDDIFGRIKKQEIEQNTPDHLRFEFLTFPVLNEDGTVLDGYPFSLEHVQQMRRSMGETMFSAIYMMKPKSEAEYILDRKKCTIINELPHEIGKDGKKILIQPLRKVRYYDFAFKTKAQNDATATALIYKYDGFSVLVEVRWWKTNIPETMQEIKKIAKQDGPDVYIGGENNTGQDAIIQTLQADRDLNEYTIIGIPTATDKVVRAMPWILRSQNGILKFLRAEWNDPFFSLAEEFGIGGEIDDPIDAVSGAWKMAGDPADNGYF